MEEDIRKLEEHAQFFLNDEDREALMNVIARLKEVEGID